MSILQYSSNNVFWMYISYWVLIFQLAFTKICTLLHRFKIDGFYFGILWKTIKTAEIFKDNLIIIFKNLRFCTCQMRISNIHEKVNSWKKNIFCFNSMEEKVVKIVQWPPATSHNRFGPSGWIFLSMQARPAKGHCTI